MNPTGKGGFIKGQAAWNAGLSKEIDETVSRQSSTLSATAKSRNWGHNAYSLEQWCKQKKRVDGQGLKRALIRAGLKKDECERCGCGPVWRDKFLSIQTHHKDGDGTNNDPSNIEMLCPNCHSQTLRGRKLNCNREKNKKRRKRREVLGELYKGRRAG